VQFECDEEKNLANQRNHDGIDFNLASRVFDDVNYVIRKDRIDEETGEQRWHALGLVAQVYLLLVVHVYQESEENEEIIRIISARKATKRESRGYFQ
jgi:uncharacterized DUF497 family protein